MATMNAFNNISIGKKLAASFALVVILVSVIAAFGINTLRLYHERSMIVASVSSAEGDLMDARVEEVAFLLRKNPQSIDEARTLADSAAATLLQLKEILVAPADGQRVDSIVAGLEKFRELLKQIETNINGDPDRLSEIVNNINATAIEIDATASELREIQVQRMDKQYDVAVITLIGIAVVIAVIAGILGWTMTRSITGPVREIVEIANKVASGDLTSEVRSDRGDEFGQLQTAFATMVTNLRELIREIETGASSIASSSEELSTVTNQTSQGVAEQQSQTDQVATAMNEMVSTVNEVARSAEAAFDAANQASEKSGNGEKAVRETLEFVADLNKQSANVMEQLNGLQAETNNIATVLDVIKSVAEQTNLLALNAAIEAARAGEHGRGFSVVADEVRSLAQRTQSSAAEIETLISNLVTSAGASVSRMETGNKLAEQTLERAELAGTVIQEMAQGVEQIRQYNSQIATAAEEQSSVAEEINQNITRISDVGDQSATSAEQVSAASDELARLAEGLNSQVSRFKI